MTPAYEMTIEEATAELERLLDTKPDEDEVLAHIHWHKANQGRVLELETWIMMHQKKGEEAPFEAPTEPDAAPEIALMDSLAHEPVSEPIPAAAAPSIPPMEQIQKHVDRAVKATADAAKATNKAQFKRAQNQIHQARFQVRALAKKHDIQLTDLPALPDLPHNPWTKVMASAPKKPTPSKPAPVKKAKAAPAAAEPSAPIEEAPIEDTPALAVTPVDDPVVSPAIVQRLINELRVTGKAVQGLAVLLAPWSNPAVAEQLQPQGLAAVAELMAIVGLHMENVADEAEGAA